MKTPYVFSVLRYVHDVLAGEFINVGVVLYAPQAKFLNAICTSRYGRLSKMFSDINSSHFRKSSRFIQSRLEEEGERFIKELPFENPPTGLKEITSKILPIDDSSLQFSPEGYGVTEDPQKTLEHIYNRYVEKYYEKHEKHSRSEDDVWRVFKKVFEEKKIIKHLQPHKIVGRNYEYEFKYCWKNQAWHANQPISFDLTESDGIIDKAHIWIGRIESLVDGGEEFKLNVLIGKPSDEKLKSSFSKAENILHKMPCKHEFIDEDKAEDFAELLRTEIEAHSHN